MTPARHPVDVVVKPIGPRCNLACEYCFYLDTDHLFPPDERFRMSEQTLETFVRENIATQPGPQVNFLWQGGEPTLLGVEFFRHAVRLQQRHLPDGWRCSNALQTNGTLLDDEWCRFLRENDFLVGISIDGPAGLHDRYRRDRHGRPTHAGVMAGRRLLHQHGVDHNALCTVNAVNADHPLEVYEFFRAEGIDWIQFIPIVEHERKVVTSRTVSPEQWGDFLIAIFDEWVRHDVGRMHVRHFEECLRVWAGLPAMSCVMARTCGTALAMEHDGTVFSCDHFVDEEHRLGNIAERPLRDLARLPTQQRFGLAKHDGLAHSCQTCEVRFACWGGCPKDRIAPDPSGGPDRDWLCEGNRRFLRHADKAMTAMAELWHQGRDPALIMSKLAEEEALRWRSTGRNDPCPCGSGRKYKMCCLGHEPEGAGDPLTPAPAQVSSRPLRG